MEHSWGLNVPDQGLGYPFVTLAAPVLTGFWAGWWVTNQVFGSQTLMVRLPLLADMPYLTGVAGFVPAPQPFPYGFDVPADVHL